MAVLALSHATPSLAQTAAKPAKSAKPVVAAAPTEIVNLNTATAAQIASLPGIGPKTADLIIQYRQKNNGFRKVEEILERPRSGPDLLRISVFGVPATVSRSRRKSQHIS
jgi:competence protein ComEA